MEIPRDCSAQAKPRKNKSTHRATRTKRPPLVAILPLFKTTPRFAVLCGWKKTQGLPITPWHLQMLTAIVHQDMPLLAKSKVLDGFQSELGLSRIFKDSKSSKSKGFCALHLTASPSSSWRGTLKPINLHSWSASTPSNSVPWTWVNILGHLKVSRCPYHFTTKVWSFNCRW